MKSVLFAVFGLLAFGLFADTISIHSGGGAVCKVDVEHGARIVSWKVQGEEMLWNPSVPQKDDGKWRHGGIPIVWPWQGDEYPDGMTNGPLHGVAWRHILSIEPSTFGMKDAKPLLPGESRVLTAVITKGDSL